MPSTYRAPEQENARFIGPLRRARHGYSLTPRFSHQIDSPVSPSEKDPR